MISAQQWAESSVRASARPWGPWLGPSSPLRPRQPSVARPGGVPDLALEEALRFHLAARIAAFKLPARITFTSAPLPRNANGKMLKSELKAMFEESDNDHAETGQTAQFRRA